MISQKRSKIYLSSNSNPIDLGRGKLQVKTGVSQQLKDMSTNKIRATGPTDSKLTFSERKFDELSENAYFYAPLM